MKKYLPTALLQVLFFAMISCQTPSNDSNPSPLRAAGIEDTIGGTWVLTKIKTGFPAAEQPVTVRKKHEFDAAKMTYKLFVDGRLTEEGKYSVSTDASGSSPLSKITFSTDASTATIYFEDAILVIGNRVPKGALLIDYDDFHYFSKDK